MYKNIGGCDMKYDEFKEMCYETWSEKYNYLCIDMGSRNRKESKYCILKENKNTFLNAFPRVKFFTFLNVVSN